MIEGDAADLDDATPPEASEARPLTLPAFAQIYERVSDRGAFDEALVAELHAALWAHPRRHFAILAGLSGSGKTLLARAYANALASAEGRDARLCTVAVQPAWYDSGSLLGYVNPLRGDTYVRTRFLEFLIAASEDPARPYVALFDEMNLSHPEQYMAPLLSAMEMDSDARVVLHAEGDALDGIPAWIPYPSNLAIVGTVNMDETTHGLSDKILDRAYTIEFWDIDLDAYPRWGQRTLSGDAETKARTVLVDLMKALRPARLHFGWRVVDEVLDFLARAESAALPLSVDAALDRVVYSKVLPKLRGDDAPRFREALEELGSTLAAHGLSESKAKVEDLALDLKTTGTARFWR